ncbi:RagB/SusD family nutrient uptake outer membrane protein [Alistipes sp.]|uniref:RagB/SusD family nutrient uptake outer membrane protein n=1 Tax=Alistipes sp. TaxID=1872444 RepID=UPI003AEF4556
MKKILIPLLAATLAACDFFDVETGGFIPPETSYVDRKSVEMALTGVYAPLSDLSFYGRDWFYAFNLQDDLSYYDRNYTKQELFLNNYTNTNATLNNLWTTLYLGIDRANSFLEYIQGSPVDEALVTRYTGEVRFLRAYYYFTLASLWGDVPLRLQSTRDAGALQMPATPAAELFRFVASEMEGVVDLVEPADRLAGPGRISQSTVAGILARVYLKMGGFPTHMGKEAYEKAAYWARQVVDSGLHTLNPSYEEVFTNLCKDVYDLQYRESIWEIEFKGNNQDGHTTGGCVGSYNGVYNNQNDSYGFGYGYVSVTLKLFDLYDDPADTRRAWNICEYYYRNGEKLWRNLNNKQHVYCNAGKFRREYELSGTRDKDYTPINFPALRYADVLLMLAEAENEAYGGPTGLALDCLDRVRRRANPLCAATEGLDQAAFRQAIVDERARELCFEGLRKQDLIRWGLYVEAMTVERRAQVADPRWHANKSYAGAVADYTEYRHNWYPIPSKELATNFQIEQNPLW